MAGIRAHVHFIRYTCWMKNPNTWRRIAGLAAVTSIVAACGTDTDISPFPEGSSSSSGGASGQSSSGFGPAGDGGTSGGKGDAGNCFAPVDMYIMLDRSGSMGADCNIGDTVKSKWCRAINALSGYLKSPEAKDQAAALQFFPLPTLTATSCMTGDVYAKPALPAAAYTTLPSNGFDALLDSTTMQSSTPTEGAIRGITTFTAANRRPGRVTIGILITDGDPTRDNGCSDNLTNLAKLLQDHNAATTVRTYVIGMTGAAFPKLEQMAIGGGAPKHPAMVGTITNACGTLPGPCTFWNVGDGEPEAFIAALKEIQKSADGCVPGGGVVNPPS
jgi:hypothetical protein